MSKKIKIALLQITGDIDEGKELAKIQVYMQKAKTLGADIVLLPELWNINYLSPSECGGIHKWKKLAITTESRQFRDIRLLAKKLRLAVVYTYLEKGSLGKLYNSATLIDARGKLVLTYRKVHTVDARWESVLTPGSNFPVAEIVTKSGKVKVGIMICYDREFPETARILMLNGAELILTPNACNIERNRLAQFQTRGYENMVGVAMTNYPAPKFNGRSVAFDGMRVKGKDYNPLIVQAGSKEGIFLAEFDLNKLREFRKKELLGNAYRKPRLYKKLIDQKVKAPFIRKDAKR